MLELFHRGPCGDKLLRYHLDALLHAHELLLLLQHHLVHVRLMLLHEGKLAFHQRLFLRKNAVRLQHQVFQLL